MSYDLTNISNSSNPGDLIVNINAATNGVPGMAILIIVYFSALILLTRVRRDNFTDAFTGAGFITAIVALLLLGMGIVSISVALFPIGLFIAGLLLKSFGS